MFEDIYTKQGQLKKHAPRQFKCLECGNIPATRIALKYSHCNFCGGNYTTRQIYTKWKKERDANEVR